MDWEGALITKVLREKDIRTPLRSGIVADHFKDSEYKAVWEFIVKAYSDPKKRGKLPSVKFIKSRFAQFEPVKCSDDMAYVVDRVRDARAYRDLAKVIEKGSEFALDDAVEAIDFFAKNIVALKGRHRTIEVVDGTADISEMVANYNRAKDLEGIIGYPYPWEQLTEDTGGCVPGDVVVLGGRPGSMKSWMTVEISSFWHELGHRPLVLTKELLPEALGRRHFSCWARLLDTDFRRGQLSEEDEEDALGRLEEWRDLGPLPIARITKVGLEAMTEIQALVEEYEPDFIIIDGFYFIGGRDWKITAECTSMLKELVMSWKNRAVINTQLNQDHDNKKEKFFQSSGGAYGDSYSQDADLFIKLRKTREDDALKEVIHIPVKVREGVGLPYAVNAIPARDLSQKYVMNEHGDILGRTNPDEGKKRAKVNSATVDDLFD